jgi:hypothetical protein
MFTSHRQNSRNLPLENSKLTEAELFGVRYFQRHEIANKDCCPFFWNIVGDHFYSSRSGGG